MAKKTIDQAIKDMQDQIDVLSAKYLELILEPEDGELKEQKAEQKKEIQTRVAALKKELKIIQSMKVNKTDKKKERELEKMQNDTINWIKKMPNSISDIVKKIPKN